MGKKFTENNLCVATGVVQWFIAMLFARSSTERKHIKACVAFTRQWWSEKKSWQWNSSSSHVQVFSHVNGLNNVAYLMNQNDLDVNEKKSRETYPEKFGPEKFLWARISLTNFLCTEFSLDWNFSGSRLRDLRHYKNIECPLRSKIIIPRTLK